MTEDYPKRAAKVMAGKPWDRMDKKSRLLLAGFLFGICPFTLSAGARTACAAGRWVARGLSCLIVDLKDFYIKGESLPCQGVI